QEDVWPKRPAFGEVVEDLAHETIGFGAAVKRGVAAELCRLSLYEQRIRRALEKTRAELAAVQAQRRAAEAAAYGARTEADARAEAEAALEGLAEVEARRAAEPPRPTPAPERRAPDHLPPAPEPAAPPMA